MLVKQWLLRRAPVMDARYGMHVVHNRRCLSKEFAFFPDWSTVKMLLQSNPLR
jgi:hypothetical protein